MRRDLPSGTVTFLFTDIEGSTRLLDALGEQYGESLEAHRRLLRQALAEHGGVEVDTQGDAFFFVFQAAGGAVQAAARAQRSLADHDWPGNRPVRVRMGVHTGEPGRIAEGYVGGDLHRATATPSGPFDSTVLPTASCRRCERPLGVWTRSSSSVMSFRQGRRCRRGCARARSEGAAMSLDEAIAYALEAS